MLGRNPPPSYEAQLLTRFAEVGIDGKRRWVTLPAELQAIWQAAWPALHKGLAAPPEDAEQTSNGWHYSSARAGNFGTDYGLRARIALRGLLALESVEACYAGTAVDEGGQPLSGAHRYRLRLAPGNLPVNAFWSLSMYAREPDGRSYFVANPIERYAIGDRTAGLIMGDDGTIDIWIQQDAPLEPARRANWLPAPAGAFRVTLRAYEPRAEFRDGRVRLPALERQD
ncbi:MAG: DUF1214 domain-containing protein [Cupriavidus necator]